MNILSESVAPRPHQNSKRNRQRRWILLYNRLVLHKTARLKYFFQILMAPSLIFRCGKSDKELVLFAAAATNDTLSCRDSLTENFPRAFYPWRPAHDVPCPGGGRWRGGFARSSWSWRS